MNAEELKMILDAIMHLGDAGRDAFIWWLVAKYIIHHTVLLLALLGAGCCLFYGIKRFWDQDRESKAIQELSLILNINCYRDERPLQVVEAVRKLKGAK